jgi:hypothetical protein
MICLEMVAALGLMIGASGPAAAGLIIVSGDENITDALVGNGVAVNAGNQQFFKNVLDGGTHVLVQGTDIGTGIDTPVANTNTFYNSVAGVTSTIQSGAVTAASLAGVDLFVSAIPANAFSASEISALAAFSASGGKIFLMGDGVPFAASQDANLNALLVGIGSSMRIVPDGIDAGFRTVGSSQIASNPLTTGVTSFTYTFVSQVSGGTTLFTASGGQTYIAETGLITSVPEPSSLAFGGIAGVVSLAYYARRGRKRAAA